MKDQVSISMLRQRIGARIRKIGESGVSVSGSFVRTSRKCGNPNCRCADGVDKHPCCLLTSKAGGKTKAVYVPKEMEVEVESWVKERKKIKKLLKEMDEMVELIIKKHVKAKRAASRNRDRLSQ